LAEYSHIPIAEIIVDEEKHRQPDSEAVNELADSMKRIGLMNPINITGAKHLLAGRHRLEAAKKLSWAQIPAHIMELDELDAELAQIDENLIRYGYTVLERGEKLKRRKEIYEIQHPETKAGVAGAHASNKAQNKASDASDTMSFASDTARKTGKNKRTIEREVQIATQLDEGVKKEIADTSLADSKKELLVLARQDKKTQKKILKKLKEKKAKNVRKAIKQIEREKRIAARSPTTTLRYRLLHSDFREVADNEVGDVDFIITDPPYEEEYLPLYGDLARKAQGWLPEGGSLLVMTGQSYLPEILATMTPHLTYQWTLSYLTPGGQSAQLWQRKVNTFWKPVLWFVKG